MQLCRDTAEGPSLMRPGARMMKIVWRSARMMLATVAVRLMTACVGTMLLFAAAPSRAADKPKTFIDIRVGDMPPGTIRSFRWKGTAVADAAALPLEVAPTPHQPG